MGVDGARGDAPRARLECLLHPCLIRATVALMCHSKLRFRGKGLGIGVKGVGFTAKDFLFRMWGLRCRIQGLGFRVQGLGFRV